jgi:hypothetical protein
MKNLILLSCLIATIYGCAYKSEGALPGINCYDIEDGMGRRREYCVPENPI